jgi:hypothetical protein
MPQGRQRVSVAVQFAGELSGGNALMDARDQFHDFRGPVMGLLQLRAGPGIENPLAPFANVVHHNSNPVTAVGDQIMGFAAVGAA